MTACANHAGVPAAAYCRTCGKPLCEDCKRDVRGVVYCEECIAARLQGTAPPPGYIGAAAAPVDSSASLPNPTLAALLGAIPGVGAFYNGQYQKGVVHVLMFPALIMLTDKVADFFGVLFPFYFMYMMWDAYQTAKSRISGEPAPDPLGINNLFGTESPKPVPAAPGTAAAPAVASGSGISVSNAPVGAIVLIGLGVLFLLGDISHRFLHTFWPVILIVIGVWKGISRWQVSE